MAFAPFCIVTFHYHFRRYIFPKLVLEKSFEFIHDELFRVEMQNLDIFGYGAKGFTLSMIESAIEMSDGKVTTEAARKIVETGKSLLTLPVEFMS